MYEDAEITKRQAKMLNLLTQGDQYSREIGTAMGMAGPAALAALKGLEGRYLVQSYTEDAIDRAGRPRRYFRITDTGRWALNEFLVDVRRSFDLVHTETPDQMHHLEALLRWSRQAFDLIAAKTQAIPLEELSAWEGVRGVLETYPEDRNPSQETDR